MILISCLALTKSTILQPRWVTSTEVLTTSCRRRISIRLAVQHNRLLKAIRNSLPPLPEQQRIVGILDEAFEGIATAKANAEKNLQNARALFESHLQSVFTQRGKGWVEKTLGRSLHDIAVDGHVEDIAYAMRSTLHGWRVSIGTNRRHRGYRRPFHRQRMVTRKVPTKVDLLISARCGRTSLCDAARHCETASWRVRCMLTRTASLALCEPRRMLTVRFLLHFLSRSPFKARSRSDEATDATMQNINHEHFEDDRVSISLRSPSRSRSSPNSTTFAKKPNASPPSTSRSSPRWRR